MHSSCMKIQFFLIIKFFIMKNIFQILFACLLLTFFAVAMTSCSKDENFDTIDSTVDIENIYKDDLPSGPGPGKFGGFILEFKASKWEPRKQCEPETVFKWNFKTQADCGCQYNFFYRTMTPDYCIEDVIVCQPTNERGNVGCSG